MPEEAGTPENQWSLHARKLGSGALVEAVHRHRHGRGSQARELIRELLSRSTRLAGRWMSGLPEVARAESVQRVVDRVVDQVVLADELDPFVQERFHRWLKLQCINALHHATRAGADAWSTDSLDAEQRLVARLEAPGIEVHERRLDLHRALCALDTTLLEVLSLYAMEDMPIESNRPGVQTMATVLGIAPRTVRYRLSKARAELARRLQEPKS